MNLNLKKLALTGAAVLGLVALVVAIVPLSVDAVPAEGHCAFNQNKRVDYYSSWGPSPDKLVGTKLIFGCGSSGQYMWGQTSNYPVTTCTPCWE